MLEVVDLWKNYGDTQALAGLNLTARRGQVVGVAGPNGAGKSTLVRILGGEEAATSGRVSIDGDHSSFATARDRVAVVHQEPQLFPNLSVRENLVVGRPAALLGRPRLTDNDRRLLEELDIAALGNSRLGDCSLAVQQRTEIARAIAHDADMFLFDEPNSALTEEESEFLFQTMRRLADDDRIVMLVSHRLTEMVRVCDEVVVIRDGDVAARLTGSRVTTETIARELAIGLESHARPAQERHDASGSPGRERSSDEIALSVRRWSRAGVFDEIDLHVAFGEIAAIVGVEGSGAREFVASVAGLEPADGEIVVAGYAGRRALRALTAFIPASRQNSLFQNFSIAWNIGVRRGRGAIANAAGILRRRVIGREADEAVQRFRVRCEAPSQRVGALSGGNQQKVALASAVASKPRLLIAEEPTRGVDIGSKAEIYQFLREYVAGTNAAVLYCTEVTEVFEVADRVYVMDQGKLAVPLLVREYPAPEALAVAIALLEEHSAVTTASVEADRTASDEGDERF